MEKFSHSRNQSSSALSKKVCNGNGFSDRSAYDDVFGGPPKFGVPTISPRVEDYTEIFGSFHSSRASSIPVLDLPAVDEADVFFDVQEVDYSDIFGGFGVLDFAVSYEELLGRSKDGDDSSEEAWTPAETGSLSEESDYSGKNESMSYGDAHQSFDDSKEFNISDHKGNQRSKGDMSNGAHLTQLHAVHGFTVVVDETPRQTTEYENTPPKVTGDISYNRSFGGGTIEEKHLWKTLSYPRNSNDSMHTFGTEPQVGYGDNGSHLSKTFVTVSEINLRTQPSPVPPPLRPPPTADVIKGDSSRSASQLKANKNYAIEGTAGGSSAGSSPPFFDVEVDASSSAAVSAAAMKEAMEKAQAKLKNAKELMERRKEGLQNRSKLGSKKDTKHEGKSSSISNSLKDQRVRGSFETSKNLVKAEIQEEMKTAQVLPDSQEGEPFFNVAKKSAEGRQEKESWSSYETYETEGTGKWKEATEFYELVRGDKSRKGQANNEKISVKTKIEGRKKEKKAIIEPSEQLGENDNQINAALEGRGWEENEQRSANEPSEWEGPRGNFEAAKEAYRPEENETVEVARMLQGWGENDKTWRVGLEHEIEHKLNVADEWEEHDILIEIQQKENEVEVKEAIKQDNERKLKEAKQRTGNDSKLKKAQENEKSEKRMKEALEPEETEKKLNAENEKRLEALKWQENEKNKKEACEREENVRGLKAALDWEENKKKQKEACEREENARGLKAALDWEENEKKQKEACEREENEKKQKEAHEREENEKREKTLKQEQVLTRQEACEREENEKRLKEALECKENEKKQNAYEKRLKEACEREEIVKKLKDEEREETERKQKEVQRQAEGNKRLNETHERKETESRLEEMPNWGETDKRLKEATKLEESKKRHGNSSDVGGMKGLKKAHDEIVNENEKNLKFFQGASVQMKENSFKATDEACKLHENNKIQATQLAHKYEVNSLEANQVALGDEESGKIAAESLGIHKNFKAVNVENVLVEEIFEASLMVDGDAEQEKDIIRLDNPTGSVLLDEKVKKSLETDIGIGQENVERILRATQMASSPEDLMKNFTPECGERVKSVKQTTVSFEPDNGKDKFSSSQVSKEWVEIGQKAEAAQAAASEGKGNIQKAAQQVSDRQSTVKKEKNINETPTLEEREREERVKREGELEKERLRKLEEEREREREREKDRMAIDGASREARDRAYVEARERAERAVVEKANAEARQRALTEARERLEKACAEAREKTFSDKSSIEARLRAERAAVERATAEARERAFEKAMAEKAVSDARERMERSVSEKFSVSSRNSGMWQSSSSDLQSQSTGSSSGSRYPYSSVYGASYNTEKSEGVEGESAQRCKARLERYQRTAERAANALAEKNKRDLLAQREQAERNRLAETLDADVKRWSIGKEGNLRALLSTLQYILGPDSGWQPIPLTDVITAVAVKKAYRKATLCVHPDKLQQRGASIQQKYICEKVFDLLKEAWNKFNSEER